MSQQALKSAKTLFEAYKGALATLEADIGEAVFTGLVADPEQHRPCCCIGDGQIGYYWP